ncbi:MAG: murein biosynthesis integral membrane protein MurJ [Rhodospirillaceae bacterium]|jgi:putative peptidoglycan lipid II flippase
MNFFKNIATVSMLTMLSRILGFLRDILIAALLGAGPVADAFFVALKLPNFFRSLTAEGAFNAAFIPLFGRVVSKDGKSSAREFASSVLSVMILTLLGFISLIQIAMPFLMYAFAPGFADDPARFNLAIDLTRITFPYLLFVSLVALLGGVLNSFNKFAAAASTPIIFNICLIGGLLILSPLFETPGHGLAWGVALAGVIQFLWLIIACRQIDMVFLLRRPKLTPQIKRLFRLIVPGAIGAGIIQINSLLGIFIASFLPIGSVSFLFYADRLTQLPLGVIGVAIGTVILPVLTRQISQGDNVSAAETMNRSVELGLVFSVPAGLGLLFLSSPIVELLFQRGAFDVAASKATALALSAYAPGLPAYFLIKVLAPGFFARGDTVTPVKIAGVCVIANLVLSIIFVQFFDHVGIALATSISAWASVALLWAALTRRKFLKFEARLGWGLLGISLSSAGMLVVLFFGRWVMSDMFSDTFLERCVALGILIIACMFSYGLIAVLTGVVSVSKFRDLKKG